MSGGASALQVAMQVADVWRAARPIWRFGDTAARPSDRCRVCTALGDRPGVAPAIQTRGVCLQSPLVPRQSLAGARAGQRACSIRDSSSTRCACTSFAFASRSAERGHVGDTQTALRVMSRSLTSRLFFPVAPDEVGYTVANVFYVLGFACSTVVAWVLRTEGGDRLASISALEECETGPDGTELRCFRKEAVLRVACGSILFVAMQLLLVLSAVCCGGTRSVCLAHGGARALHDSTLTDVVADCHNGGALGVMHCAPSRFERASQSSHRCRGASAEAYSPGAAAQTAACARY